MSEKTKSMELKVLKDKCLLFNQFMAEKGALPAQLAEAYKESNKLIESAYMEGKIKPLKSMSADIDNQVIRHMPLSMAQELKNLFKEKLNIDYDVVDKVRMKVIEKLLKKGKISNPDEYELLLNRVDEIYLDPNRETEVKRLNELLAEYYNK
ncbi:MAG: hypothetical protein JJU02_00820 [Cryomorphaceae bacterium]|nr:hypothetical protein [Cryomorphaceae bacterium]